MSVRAAQGPRSGCRRFLLGAGGLLVLASSCGSGDEPAVGSPESGSAAEARSSGGDAPATSSALETPPESAAPLEERRAFRDNRAGPRLGPWYAQLQARVSPDKDGQGWWTEVVAEVAEKVLGEGIGQYLHERRAAQLAAALGHDFRGLSLLRPPADALETLRADARGKVRAWRGGPLAQGTAADLERNLAQWLDPLRGGADARVLVQVVGVVALEGRRYQTEAWIRAGSSTAGACVQTNARWTIEWSIPPKGKRLLITSIELTSFEEVELSAPPFAELTQAILAADQAFGLELMRGAPEYERRVDRTTDFTTVHMGMHGMAVGDVDGDGLDDVYVGTQAGRPNALLVQQQDGTVRDLARAAEVDFLDDTAGVLIVDMDGDGHRDLVLAMGPGVLVAYNDGELGFPRRQHVTCKGSEQVYSVSAADADRDGDLDLYATRYIKGGVIGGVPTPYHDAHNGATNVYFRNDEGALVDATAAVGLDQGNDRFSLSSLWEDFDRDGDLDLYVTNDFGKNNLYRNEGGRFTDVAAATGTEDVGASMGISCADVEQDGDLDLYVSNMFSAAGSRIATQPQFMARAPIEVRASYARHARGNTLLLARGDGSFEDASEHAEISPGGWTWGAMFLDFENDGLPDIFVPDGFVTTRDARDLESFFWRCVVGASPLAPPATEAYKQAWNAISMMAQEEGYSWNGHERDYAYWNLGGARFVDVSQASGLDYQDDARVACVTDWDGDGRLDLWIRNRTAPIVRFLHGRPSAPGNWIAFDLLGRAPNRDAIGALVELEAGGKHWVRRLYCGEGYLGSSSARLHFGLESVATLERVLVHWPDGQESLYEDLEAGAVWTLEQGVEQARRRPAREGCALAGIPARRIAETLGPRVTRVPLFDALPLRALELPRWEGSPAHVGDFAGRPLCVFLWTSWNRESLQALERLEADHALLDEAGVALYPLSVDEPREVDVARAAIESGARTELGGRADERVLTVIEIAFVEALGNYSDLPLPAALLFDGSGSLCALYFGTVDARELAADARSIEAARSANEGHRQTALSGGRWAVSKPARALDTLRKLFESRGYSELAREMASEIEARRE